MNTIILFAFFVVGTQAGQIFQASPAFLTAHAPALVLPQAAPFATPGNTVYSSGLSAGEVLAGTGHAALLPDAVSFLNHGGIHTVVGAYSSHYAAPSYGYALRK